MIATLQSASEQSLLWNGQAGRAWVEAQPVLDAMFKPLEALLVEAAPTQSGARVLDVGCGTGSTTLAVAGVLGAKGQCVGVDISEPMVAAARARAERLAVPASFVLADAETHGFEPASFDLIISRFGLMFFHDPVRAFANLRSAARAGGELRFIAWRGPAENPFMTAAERAAAPLLPGLPPREPNAPGQFAFADPRRLRRILEESGWQEIAIRALDVRCRLPEKDLMAYLARLGPLGRLLPGLDEKTRSRVLQVARAAFEPYVQGDWVSYDAACWSVGARAP